VPVVPWIATASDAYCQAVLITATRLLDACFQWTGIATTDTQALCWYRAGMLSRNGRAVDSLTIPLEIKAADCEMAVNVGSGDLLASNDAAKQNVSSVAAGSVNVHFQNVDSSHIEAVNLAIRRAGSEFNYVSNFVPDVIRIMLVPSWYVQAQIVLPAILRAI